MKNTISKGSNLVWDFHQVSGLVSLENTSQKPGCYLIQARCQSCPIFIKYSSFDTDHFVDLSCWKRLGSQVLVQLNQADKVRLNHRMKFNEACSDQGFAKGFI